MFASTNAQMHTLPQMNALLDNTATANSCVKLPAPHLLIALSLTLFARPTPAPTWACAPLLVPKIPTPLPTALGELTRHFVMLSLVYVVPQHVPTLLLAHHTTLAALHLCALPSLAQMTMLPPPAQQ